jgi:hypothetical protein
MSASRVPALQAFDINEGLAEQLILCCSVEEQMVEQPCCDTKQPGVRIFAGDSEAIWDRTESAVATGRAHSLTAMFG